MVSLSEVTEGLKIRLKEGIGQNTNNGDHRPFRITLLVFRGKEDCKHHFAN